jgi:beta-galactosidase
VSTNALRAFTFIAALAASALFAARAAADFPAGFEWGTAVAGFQTEMGANPADNDTNSDWWVWVHDPQNIANGWVSGDLPEDGPGSYSLFDVDATLAQKKLRSTTFRLGIEWSRIFPNSTASVDTSGGITLTTLQQLDALADQAAVAHYRDVLTSVRTHGMVPLVTLQHFTLPLWIHDPIAARDALAGIDPNAPLPTGFPGGWLDTSTIDEFEKYAAYIGWKFGDLVDRWVPINEPVVIGASGYVNLAGFIGAYFPPGAFSYTALLTVLSNVIEGQAAGYDALKAFDVVDADGDGGGATVGVVHNMVAFEPEKQAVADDVLGAAHANYLFNSLFLNSIMLGQTDPNADGVSDMTEYRPDLVGKADFIGVNYYFRGKVQGLGGPITPTLPLLDFLPHTAYSAGGCPTLCTEFGWEIYPQGLRQVLQIAGSYGVPVYITENGLADSDDDQRKLYLVSHLAVLDKAIADNVADVRGYYHWSLVDNFEWASGYYPAFGLFSYDPTTLKRHARPSSHVFKKIAKKNVIPPSLLKKYAP